VIFRKRNSPFLGSYPFLEKNAFPEDPDPFSKTVYKKIHLQQKL